MELKLLSSIDDIKFTSVRGEEISRNNLVKEMVDYYALKVQEGETRVTDFNEGSEIRNLLESIAVDVYYLMQNENDILRNCFIDTANNAWLDRIGLHPFVQLPRVQGASAKGTVTFSIPSALTSELVIPAGTVLLGTNDIKYTTDTDCTIAIGETSENANITCTMDGVEGNVQSGSITRFDDSFVNLSGVTVNNSGAVVDGVDLEDDESYRQRLLGFVRRDDFGSVGYYKSLCEKVSGVHDVVLVDDSTYTKKVLVNGDVKPTSDAVLLDVLAVLSDLGNCVIGHTFTVDKPVFDEVDLDITVTVGSEMDTDIIVHIVEDLLDGGAREEGFEFTGLNISQGVSQQELYGLFDVIDNIHSVTIESDGEPVTDLPCTVNHVLMAGTISVEQTVE